MKKSGQHSRNTKRRMPVTTGGHGSAAQSGSAGDGEEIAGVGVSYTTTLNERTNKSLSRNAGPTRPMANKGYVANPRMSSRKTGKVG